MRYCVSPDCPYHGECEKSINWFGGNPYWAKMVDMSGVCRKYIGWVYEEVSKIDGNSKTKSDDK
jgi:hypothetical protein